MSVVYNNISQVKQMIVAEVTAIIREEPYLMSNDVKDAMNKPHSGRIYKRRTVEHRASAPGEAPAIDTGALVNSLEIVHSGPMKSALQSNQPQALALELGRPEANLLPRPYMTPAAEKSVKRIKKRLKVMKGKVQNVRR
jgi:hypothetical protein